MSVEVVGRVKAQEVPLARLVNFKFLPHGEKR